MGGSLKHAAQVIIKSSLITVKIAFYVLLRHFKTYIGARGDIFCSYVARELLFLSKWGPQIDLSLRPLICRVTFKYKASNVLWGATGTLAKFGLSLK